MANLVARQDFEGTGTPSGWTIDTAAGGTIDFDYATSPAPLTGSESLYMTASTATAITVLPTAFSASSTVDCYFKLNINTVPAATNTSIFQIRDASNNVLCALTVSNSVARFKLTHGATTVNGTADLSSGQTYHVWIDYTAGTGADGTANLYYSTTSTKPGAANIAVTTGTETASATNIFFRTESRGYDPIIIDDLIAESVIGDAGPASGSTPVIDSYTTSSAGIAGTMEVSGVDLTAVTINGLTFGGVACTSVSAADSNTLNYTMPVGGVALGSSNNFVLTCDSIPSAGVSATYNPRTGYSYFTATADATAFDTESPLYNNGMVTGDQLEYELALDPSSSITITAWDAATGLPTFSSNITVDNTSSGYIWDASDTYSVGTVDTYNWQETVAPTVSSAAIAEDGNSISISCSEGVAFGAGGTGGFALTGLDSAVTLTYSSGANSSTLVYATSRTIAGSEGAGLLAYTQPGDGAQDISGLGNDLATFSGLSVTNGSTAGTAETTEFGPTMGNPMGNCIGHLIGDLIGV